jgi:hypothetical protein
MGFWYPFIAWLFPHLVVPWRLARYRRREVEAIRANGVRGAADGVFRTHYTSRVYSVLDFRTICGAATSSFGGSPDDVNCHACLRIVRRAKKGGDEA